VTCILYVDDSRTQLESVRKVLADKGHEVRTATSVEEAVACMQDGLVEFGLIDYHMPGASGAQVLQAIRARANPPPSMRFFVYTTDNKAQADFRQHGFHGALLRKGDLDALVAQLEPVLRLMQLAKLARR
jgi:CheY-like chemotaxis protein